MGRRDIYRPGDVLVACTEDENEFHGAPAGKRARRNREIDQRGKRGELNDPSE
jgi:hypothetical protein